MTDLAAKGMLLRSTGWKPGSKVRVVAKRGDQTDARPLGLTNATADKHGRVKVAVEAWPARRLTVIGTGLDGQDRHVNCYPSDG